MRRRIGLVVASAVLTGCFAASAPAADYYKIYRGAVTGSEDLSGSGEQSARSEEYAWVMIVRDTLRRASHTRRTRLAVTGTYNSTHSDRPAENLTCVFTSDPDKEYLERPDGAFIRGGARNPFVAVEWEVPTEGYGLKASDPRCSGPLTNPMFSDRLGANVRSAESERALGGSEQVTLASLARFPWRESFQHINSSSNAVPGERFETGRLKVDASVEFAAGALDSAADVRAQEASVIELTGQLLSFSSSTFADDGSITTLAPFLAPRDGRFGSVGIATDSGDAVLRASRAVKTRDPFTLKIAATPAGRTLLARPRPARQIRLIARYDPAGRRRPVVTDTVVTVLAAD